MTSEDYAVQRLLVIAQMAATLAAGDAPMRYTESQGIEVSYYVDLATSMFDAADKSEAEGATSATEVNDGAPVKSPALASVGNGHV